MIIFQQFFCILQLHAVHCIMSDIWPFLSDAVLCNFRFFSLLITSRSAHCCKCDNCKCEQCCSSAVKQPNDKNCSSFVYAVRLVTRVDKPMDLDVYCNCAAKKAIFARLSKLDRRSPIQKYYESFPRSISLQHCVLTIDSTVQFIIFAETLHNSLTIIGVIIV